MSMRTWYSSAAFAIAENTISAYAAAPPPPSSMTRVGVNS